MLTEALIGAATEAVIERVAYLAGLEDRLRHWLRRDPARLALAKAFTRAYAAFADNYPTVTAEAEASVTTHLPPGIKHLVHAEALSSGKTVSSLVREWMALCAHFVNEERLDLPVVA